ncbi:unnamed protein product, partial [Ilex paraguariensis]
DMVFLKRLVIMKQIDVIEDSLLSQLAMPSKFQVRAMMYGRRVSVNVFGSQENSQAFYRSRGPSTITIPFRKCKGLVQVSPAANQKMNYLVGSQNIVALSIMVLET